MEKSCVLSCFLFLSFALFAKCQQWSFEARKDARPVESEPKTEDPLRLPQVLQVKSWRALLIGR